MKFVASNVLVGINRPILSLKVEDAWELISHDFPEVYNYHKKKEGFISKPIYLGRRDDHSVYKDLSRPHPLLGRQLFPVHEHKSRNPWIYSLTDFAELNPAKYNVWPW